MGPRSNSRGFTLVELLISLALLMVGLLLAAQLLEETSRLFAETSGEAIDTPVPLVISRIRGDVQGSATVSTVADERGALQAVVLAGGDEGDVTYTRRGDDLYRTLAPADGSTLQTTVLWRGVTGWGCQVVAGTSLVDLQVSYRRRSTARTPLAVLPAYRGAVTEVRTQRLFLLPRGRGLGDTW